MGSWANLTILGGSIPRNPLKFRGKTMDFLIPWFMHHCKYYTTTQTHHSTAPPKHLRLAPCKFTTLLTQYILMLSTSPNELLDS